MGKGCKGLCERFKSSKPFAFPYQTHVLCRRCDIWIKREQLLNEKCPCCSFRPKHKSYRKNEAREKIQKNLR